MFLDSPSDIPHPFFLNEVLWYEKLQAWYHPVAFENRGHAAAILQDTLIQELNRALDKHPPEAWLQAVHSDLKTYSWTDSLSGSFSPQHCCGLVLHLFYYKLQGGLGIPGRHVQTTHHPEREKRSRLPSSLWHEQIFAQKLPRRLHLPSYWC